MDIAKILKGCSKGTKLYSPICGEVEFLEIIQYNTQYPIRVKAENLGTECFTKDGKYYDFLDGECMLFPSKTNRDWSTFKVQKKHKKKYKEFKPYDKVLIRCNSKDTWTPSLYKYLDKSTNGLPHYTFNGWISDENILPYEGNEDKAGKVTDD